MENVGELQGGGEVLGVEEVYERAKAQVVKFGDRYVDVLEQPGTLEKIQEELEVMFVPGQSMAEGEMLAIIGYHVASKPSEIDSYVIVVNEDRSASDQRSAKLYGICSVIYDRCAQRKERNVVGGLETLDIMYAKRSKTAAGVEGIDPYGQYEERQRATRKLFLEMVLPEKSVMYAYNNLILNFPELKMKRILEKMARVLQASQVDILERITDLGLVEE